MNKQTSQAFTKPKGVACCCSNLQEAFPRQFLLSTQEITVPFRSLGQLTSAWTFLPRIIQQARPGIGTEELIPLPFPLAQLRMKLKLFVFKKQQQKKKRQKPDKLRNWHILLQGGRCFTTRHLRKKCRHCPAVLGSILTWDPTAQSSSNTSPKAGSSAPNQPELHKPGQTGHFSLPVHLQARHWGSTSYGCLRTLHKWVKCIKTDFPGRNFFLRLNLNLPSFSLKPFPLSYQGMFL